MSLNCQKLQLKVDSCQPLFLIFFLFFLLLKLNIRGAVKLDIHFQNTYEIMKFFTSWIGHVALYRLYSSPSVGVFYTSLNSTNFVNEINSTKIAGRRESYRMKAVDFNKNLYYTMIAVDKAGNIGAVSNVRGAFMPSPEVEAKASKGVDGVAAHTEDLLTGSEITVTNHKKPYKIVVFLAVGVLSFLVICIFCVVLIVLVNRRKKTGDDFSSENSIYSSENEDRLYGGGSGANNFYPTKPSVYDEQATKFGSKFLVYGLGSVLIDSV